MFNNLVNSRDLLRLAKKIGQGQFDRIFLKLTSKKEEKVKKAWKYTKAPPTNWWDIPAVRERWNYLISGNPKVDYYEYVSRKYFSRKKNLRGLSLACGTGHRELRWAELGKFKKIDAYDLSKTRIKYARKQAKKKGYDKIINYQVADVYDIKMQKDFYDVVLAEQSLHHFSPLKKILLRIASFLKPNGFLIVNEFVGPTRFQWTNKQLEIVNDLLSSLPDKYKTRWKSSSIKSKVFRPSRLSMILDDPSEAVESSKILPLLNQIFNVVEIKEYGGTILNLLFSEIAHNFLSEDSETQRILRLCFEAEDSHLKNKDIQSDFVIAVCRKRLSSSRSMSLNKGGKLFLGILIPHHNQISNFKLLVKIFGVRGGQIYTSMRHSLTKITVPISSMKGIIFVIINYIRNIRKIVIIPSCF